TPAFYPLRARENGHGVLPHPPPVIKSRVLSRPRCCRLRLRRASGLPPCRRVRRDNSPSRSPGMSILGASGASGSRCNRSRRENRSPYGISPCRIRISFPVFSSAFAPLLLLCVSYRHLPDIARPCGIIMYTKISAGFGVHYGTDEPGRG